MFSLRKETDYALQFLKFLAKSPRKSVSLMEVADATGLSFLFLQKIARKLRLAGILSAELGVDGGYKLKIVANKLTLKKIIAVIEGGCSLCTCCEKGVCKDKGNCLVGKKIRVVNNKILRILEGVKLSDL
jgi:Rrf2 family protein